MGNCTGKPKVTETAMPPAPLKEEESSTAAVVSDVKIEGETKSEIVEEGVTSENRSLGVLLKEVPEAKDDKTEVESAVVEPVKEEIKAEPSTEKVPEPVKAEEEVKVDEVAPVVEKKEEAPVAVVVPPVVEAVKVEEKAVEAPVAEVVAPVVEVAAPVPVEVAPVPVVETEKVAPAPVTEDKTGKAAEVVPVVSTPEEK